MMRQLSICIPVVLPGPTDIACLKDGEKQTNVRKYKDLGQGRIGHFFNLTQEFASACPAGYKVRAGQMQLSMMSPGILASSGLLK
jgi:hypothetical protein